MKINNLDQIDAPRIKMIGKSDKSMKSTNQINTTEKIDEIDKIVILYKSMDVRYQNCIDEIDEI